MKPAYYNEIDPVAAQWLRNLIAAGHIAPGDVDERSIEDVRSNELMGYRQCHFFAGIGIWSYALRRAGVHDDCAVWTGSCPCQPFSTAGQGDGFADERHLWPAFFHLIEQCRPAAVLGEQVASADADPWVDLVCADLERLGYAFGATPFPAAGVGAPHIRDRLYWVGYAGGQRLPARERPAMVGARRRQEGGAVEQPSCASRGLADHPSGGFGIIGGALEPGDVRHTDGGGDSLGGMADAVGPGFGIVRRGGGAGSGHQGPHTDLNHQGHRPGPVNGHWRDADWLLCRDGKWRPVEPGTFPLAHGIAGRVGRLRAYGNGLCASAAQAFIECVMEAA